MEIVTRILRPVRVERETICSMEKDSIRLYIRKDILTINGLILGLAGEIKIAVASVAPSTSPPPPISSFCDAETELKIDVSPGAEGR